MIEANADVNLDKMSQIMSGRAIYEQLWKRRLDVSAGERCKEGKSTKKKKIANKVGKLKEEKRLERM
ncbi:hypothetical protein PR048_006085 [Dryococelus australis]|uniref:Uncharacterized protein n=1 Tax=Dryococelus australis TaxID=614101 RepID=A0ABQ9I9Z9_9NEOP|nr:hypothetical protein PR048_006085 [Dryococelus australis]